MDNTTVLVRYVYAGDANLDGSVDTLDFNAVAANFGGTNKVWTQGDFNYDGNVDTLDFNIYGSNSGQSGPSAPSGGGNALVPEPASLGALIIVGAALVRHKRRTRA